ncbi:DUF6338 family protein [Bradyrhizobium quebecense]|uniref:Uncharacterized protein n=1 Tax=Bradyrhizobium quebecense TaxID=2748629 RepID=A0A973WQE5_9BRAD|nr:DUF6338 family protein [Bradyrhizobium quebecense]UGA46680.1 DUF6338 family protein [Bradyrhizobium quebecense]
MVASLEAVYVAIFFLVPGYIFLTFRNQFVAGQDRLGTEQILAFITFSALNLAIFGWIIFTVPQTASGWIRVLVWAVVLLVGPAILGFVSGIWTQKELGEYLYTSLGLSLVHPTARSWDWIFHRVRPCFVLVTLKDGSQCAGYWGVSATGTQSFASSDPKERDLYISQIFEIPDEGPWRPTQRSIFIAAGEIRSIEFIQEETSE